MARDRRRVRADRGGSVYLFCMRRRCARVHVRTFGHHTSRGTVYLHAGHAVGRHGRDRRAAPAGARRRARARAAMPARESSGAPVAFPWLDATYAPVTFAPWTTDARRRAWVGVFRASAASFERRAALDEASGDGATARARAFARAFEAACARCEAGDEDAREACRGEASGGAWWAPWEGVNCLEMCRARDGILRRCGFADCFRGVKAAENATALRALAGALAATDGIEDDGERLLALVRGVFAGNIFDLGAAASAGARARAPRAGRDRGDRPRVPRVGKQYHVMYGDRMSEHVHAHTVCAYKINKPTPPDPRVRDADRAP